MNKKSFTLIELISVIIILAVIALIATPILLNVIDKAKEKSNLLTVNGLLDAARLYYIESAIDENKKTDIENVYNIYKKVSVHGTKPVEGQLHANSVGSTAVAVILDKKCYIKKFDKNIEITEDKTCSLGFVGIDKTEPTIEFSYTGLIGNNDWYKSDVYVTIQVLDDQSGPSKLSYCQTKEETCIPLIEIQKTEYKALVGNNEKVCVIGYDVYGNYNEEVKCSNVIKADKDLPVFNGINNIVVNIGETVDLRSEITTSDITSGIDEIFTVNPSSVDTSIVGTTTITYSVFDVAGNTTTQTITVEVLGNVPTIEFSSSGTFNESGWSKSNFYINANITDNSNKGIKSTKWCSTTTTCTPIANVSGNVSSLITNNSETNKICVEVIDNNNKTTTQCSNNYKLDTVKPNFSGISNLIINKGENLDLRSGVIATDITSGIDETFAVNPSSVDTSIVGTTTVTYSVSDIAGNTTTQTITVEVLGNVPTIEFSSSGTFNESGWSKTNFYISANIIDNSNKGIKSTKWCSTTTICTPNTSVVGNVSGLITNNSETNKICVEVIDNNNKTTTQCSNNYKLDTVKPSFSGISDIKIQKGDLIDLRNGITANDTTSLINGTFTVNPSSVDTSISGITNIEYSVTDNAGNTTTITRKIIVDSEAPTVTYTPQGSTINSNGWSKQDFYVKVDLVDNSGLGIKEGKWCISQSNTCTPNALIEGTTMMPLITTESNNNRICVQATDNNNKQSGIICSDAYKLDKTMPTAGTANITGSLGLNGWYTDNVSITFNNGSDNLSGHLNTTTNISRITNNTSGDIVTITTSDIAGNIATRKYTIKLDKGSPTAPVVRLNKNSSNGTTYTSNTWSNQPIYATISYSGTKLSGISYYEYSNNGSTWYKMTSNPMTISTEGTTNLYFRAVDNAGNYGTATSQHIIKYDRTSPALPDITMRRGSSSGTAYTSNTWTNEYIYISANYSRTETSGISYYEYSNNGSTWYKMTSNPMIISTEGTTNLYFRAVDNALNYGTATSQYIVKLDRTTPTAPDFKMNAGSTGGAGYTSNTWANKDVYVTLSYSKTDPSGITYQYSMEGGTWTNMTSTTMTISKEGTTKIKFRLIDGAGNIGTITSEPIIKVDKIAPSAPSLSIKKGSDYGSTYYSGDWTPLDLYITGNYSKSDTSGIMGYQMSTDNRNWTVASLSTSRINIAGEYTVYLRAVDNAGNIGSVVTMTNVKKAAYLVDKAKTGYYVNYQNQYWRVLSKSGSGSTGTVTLVSDTCLGSLSFSMKSTASANSVKNGLDSIPRQYYNSTYISSYRSANTSEVYSIFNLPNRSSCPFFVTPSNSAAYTVAHVTANSSNYTHYTANNSSTSTITLSGGVRPILTVKSGIYITTSMDGSIKNYAFTLGY